MRYRFNTILTATLILLVSSTCGAAGIDLHWLWDDRCAECHGHAAEFARTFLNASGNELQGKHHVQDLKRFMHNHYLMESEVDAVYNMLYAQASSQPRFRNECSGCHDTAASFVRNSLELRDGNLYGVASGRTARSFLEHHRGLSPEDIEFYSQLLTRIANEVYRP